MRIEPLHPFSECGEAKRAGVSLEAFARVHQQDLILEYRLKVQDPGFLQGLVPALSGARDGGPAGTRKDGLWKETCFEAFIGKNGSDGYFEFNGSVRGDWNLYSFEGYRAGMKEVPVTADPMPRLAGLGVTDGSLELEFSVPLELLGGESAIGRMGLTAVLKTAQSTSYWAIRHAGEKPDFHLRRSFCHDPVRN
jgi:hypothetical protein